MKVQRTSIVQPKYKKGFIFPGSYSQVLVEPLRDLWKIPTGKIKSVTKVKLQHIKANDGDTKAELKWNEFS